MKRDRTDQQAPHWADVAMAGLAVLVACLIGAGVL
jgi:hypothetical protein